MLNIKIKRVKHSPIYDVFMGSGWKHHTRIKYKGKQLERIYGIPLTDSLCNDILAQLKGSNTK